MKSPENGSYGVKSEFMGRFLPFFSGNPHQNHFVLIGISTRCLPEGCASLYVAFNISNLSTRINVCTLKKGY